MHMHMYMSLHMYMHMHMYMYMYIHTYVHFQSARNSIPCFEKPAGKKGSLEYFRTFERTTLKVHDDLQTKTKQDHRIP